MAQRLACFALCCALLAAYGCSQTSMTGDNPTAKAPQSADDSLASGSGTSAPTTTTPDNAVSTQQPLSDGSAPVATTPAPVSSPSPTTTISTPTACTNTLRTSGVKDPLTGKTYIMLNQLYNYCDAEQACAKLGANGTLAVVTSNWPDAMLACSNQLPSYWAQPSPGYADSVCFASSGWSLFDPGPGQVRDPSVADYAICTF